MNSSKRNKKNIFLSIATLILVALLFSILPQRVVSETATDGSLPVDVYVVSLSDVGNFRATNHSMVLEGALQATEVNKINVFLNWGNYAKVNVSVTANVVTNWDTYRSLVESGDNVIIVNTHDEYLPIPSSYTREQWVDMIADFMLNRWGTWVHLGGYPLYCVWYQNGTIEEWGEQGFKTLMKSIGKDDVDCKPPVGYPSEDAVQIDPGAVQSLGASWYWSDGNHSHPLHTFAGANMGNPLKYDDFKENIMMSLFYSPYKGKGYFPGATIHFGTNESTFNFGIYVHLGAWRFYDGDDQELTEFNDLAMGFISTAAAIWADVGEATYELYSDSDDTALDAIRIAKIEGRTIDLNQAEELLQKGIDEYNSGNYKMAISYAKQAKKAAESSSQPNYLPVTIAAVGIGATALVVGGYWILNSKKNRRKTECTE